MDAKCSQLGYQLFTGVAGNAGSPHLENMETKKVAYTQLLPLDGRRETLALANLLPSSLGEETLGTFSGQYSLLSTLFFVFRFFGSLGSASGGG